jgi:regulation of enolase protein 1 (concanavalin A-like superfamily)
VSSRLLFFGPVIALLVGLVIVIPSPAVAQTLPANWEMSDVGTPGVAGHATHADGTFTVSGSGTGIGSRLDSFTFVYQQLTGDATIIARVGGLQNAPSNAQAGVMIRQTLDSRSIHASFLLSRTNQIMFKRRTAPGATTTNTKFPAPASAVWLKLERRSTAITASWSTNGSAWTTVGTATVAMNNVVYVGLPVTSYTDVAPAVATFSSVQISSLIQSGGALPTGWASEDVGSPIRAGSASYRTGTFALSGAGVGISGYSDQFRYAYRRIDGDVDIVARIRDLGNTTSLSKAGLMIRDSLTPSGAHASMFVNANGESFFQRRALPGGATSSRTASTPQGAPLWLKLSLRAGTVTGFQSLDGVIWTRVSSVALTLPSPYYLGLAVTSRDETAAVTTNIDEVDVRSVDGMPQQAPEVSISAPSSGMTLTAPATITVSATASDADGTVERVDFYHGSTFIGSDTTSPYSVTWSNIPAGAYSLTARARDDDGMTATSAAVTVTANAPNQPPSVSLTAPANGATFTAPGTITVAAAASDPDGTVARVDFYRGSTLIGTDASSPYSVTSGSVPAGTYSLTARATDNDGTTTVSVARSITVNASGNQAPSVSLTAPANGATFTAPATITVSATASDTDGTVARVDFFQGSTLIGTDTSSPYSVSWTNVGAGSYTLTARATDNAAATTTSAGRTVTVTGGLPTGWTTADIGNPAIAGSTSYGNGTFTVRAGGVDIWGTSDEFRYVYRQISGDFDVIGRVVSAEEADPWSKAGVMIRATLAADAANASMFVAASKPHAFQRRTAPGGTTITTNVQEQGPSWVKLARRGATITAFTAPDGATWTVIGTQTMTLPASFYVGIAVSGVNATLATTAVIDNVTVTAATGNQPPSVSLTAPANGATFTAPATITVSASASDSDGAVARVEFYRGSTLIGSDTASPYSVTWNNVAAGSYSLTARAVDNTGAVTTSTARSITVSTGSATQRTAVFTASPDHNTLVTSYLFEVFAAGANPATATPLASRNLGKPAVVNGEVTADVTTTINALAAGNYQATVAAVGSGGSSRSAPATFTR